MALPTLDFSLFRNASDPQAKEVFCDQLKNSMTNLGFVKLINYGLDEDLIAEAMEWVSAFVIQFRGKLG
jgi:isopenicillin N synthase-like dioxygenase